MEMNAGWLQSYMTIILFIILETGWGRQRGSWRSHSYAVCECKCVCVCMCVCISSAFMYIYRSIYLSPPCTLIATLVRNAFNIVKHETMGYKFAFQPDIFDMISHDLSISLVWCLFLFFPDSCRLCSVWVAPLKNATFSSPGAPEMWGGRLRGVVLKKLLILRGRDLERQQSNIHTQRERTVPPGKDTQA